MNLLFFIWKPKAHLDFPCKVYKYYILKLDKSYFVVFCYQMKSVGNLNNLKMWTSNLQVKKKKNPRYFEIFTSQMWDFFLALLKL